MFRLVRQRDIGSFLKGWGGSQELSRLAWRLGDEQVVRVLRSSVAFSVVSGLRTCGLVHGVERRAAKSSAMSTSGVEQKVRRRRLAARPDKGRQTKWDQSPC